MKDLTTLEKYRLKDDERRIYGINGDAGNGIFKIFINGRSFRVIASNGGGWEHVSVTLNNQKRCPTWEEMCAIKDTFFDEEETVMQLHPPVSDYVNNHPYCLHLWKPTGDVTIPRPPSKFV